MLRVHEYLYVFEPARFIHDVIDELKTLREAVEALASEPGQPHHAAAEALKILNRES